MNASRIAPVLAILALSVACQDQPTAVSHDDLKPQLFQEGKGNFVLWFSATEGGELGEVVRCLNDGEGEDIYFYTSYSVWGKDHWTPSGNYLANVKLTFGEESYLRGLTTGEIWRLDRMHESSPQKIKVSDGLFTIRAQLWERYVNEDGDVVHLHENYWVAFDGPNVVRWDVKITCGPRK